MQRARNIAVVIFDFAFKNNVEILKLAGIIGRL